MWQDWVIFAVQIGFFFALLPTVLHATHKPTMSTSLFTAAGMYVLCVTYATLALWFATAMAAVIGTMWLVLAYQRRALHIAHSQGDEI